MADVYRQAASLLLLRPATGPGGIAAYPYELLLLHKPRKRDAWQLPQGGIEAGETVAQAALRELHEEAGISGATLLRESAEVYQYDFPTTYRRFRPDHVCGQCIRFAIAMAPADTTVTLDVREVDQYVWVTPDQVRQYIRRPPYLELVHRIIGESRALLPS